MHSKRMDFRRELSNSLHEKINGLEGSDQQTVSLRLEVLFESALINGDVPLDAIDLIDQARKQLIATQVAQARYMSSSMWTFALLRDSSDLHIYKEK